MAFFGLFGKEKKETLDKGLEKTKESVLSKIGRAIAGKTTVDDDVLDNLEEALITSDVGVETTLRVIERIQERVKRDKYMGTSELNRILVDEVASLLAENNSTQVLDFADQLRLPHTESLIALQIQSIDVILLQTNLGMHLP